VLLGLTIDLVKYLPQGEKKETVSSLEGIQVKDLMERLSRVQVLQ
jgi:hypothetical protein